MTKTKIVFYYLIAIVLFAIAIGSLTLLTWNLFLQAFGTFGGTIVFTLFVTYLFNTIPHFQKIYSHILLAFSFVKRAELKSIKLSIEGNINSSREMINSEIQGAMPYPVRVDWVQKENPDTFLDKYTGEVIVRMKPHDYQPRNLVYATLNSVSKGFLNTSRLYLDDAVNTAIDYTMTKKILSGQGQTKALDDFLSEVVQPRMSDAELRTHLETMEKLDENGIFSRLLIREFLELGRELYPRYDKNAHLDTQKFLGFLKRFAERERGQEDVELSFGGKRIRVRILLVAKREKFYMAGPEPYVLYAKGSIDHGYDSLYILAGGVLVSPAKIVMRELEKSEAMNKIEGTDETYVTKHEGKDVEKVCVVFKVKSSQ